jgi:hypothetical protein
MISDSFEAPSGDTMVWTRPKLNKLRRAYNRALKDSKGDMNAVFEFDHHDFVIGYCKYLIEFLDQTLK